MPIFIPRTLRDEFQADAIAQQGRVVLEDIRQRMRPLLPGAEPKTPPSASIPQLPTLDDLKTAAGLTAVQPRQAVAV